MNHKQEIGTGLFFLVLSVFYIALSLPIKSFDPFGNSYLTSKAIPQVIGGLVFLISVIHIGISFGKLMKEKKAQTGSSHQNAGSKTGKIRFDKSFRLMLITILLIAAYIFFFTRLGFILSSILFLLVQIFVMVPPENRKKWAIFIVCFSICIPVGIYFLFTRVLAMFLPRGLVG